MHSRGSSLIGGIRGPHWLLLVWVQRRKVLHQHPMHKNVPATVLVQKHALDRVIQESSIPERRQTTDPESQPQRIVPQAVYPAKKHAGHDPTDQSVKDCRFHPTLTSSG